MRKLTLSIFSKEAKLQKLLSTCPIGIFQTTPKGQFVEANQAVATALGYADIQTLFQEINAKGIGQALFDDPTQREQMVARLQNAPGEWLTEEVTYRQKNNQLIDVQLCISLQAHPTSGTPLIVGFVQDISEHRRREHEQRKRDQLMAIGMLAGSVAHDFNNLLSGIQGYIELLTLEENTLKIHRHAHQLETHIKAGIDMTGSLLRFARQSGDNPSLFCASEAVEGALALFRMGRGRHLRVMAHLPVNNVFILGFKTQFQNAVLNLCLNALDAMAQTPNAELLVEATIGEEPAHQQTNASETVGAKYFHLIVADNGPGMSPEVLAKCTTPFFSTKGENGTGLGLPSVQMAVKEHRGKLDIQTKQGKGCKVHIYIPIAAI